MTPRKIFTVVDLFSGAGGLTFGFKYKKRGNTFIRNNAFNFLFANEFDIDAGAAFGANFPDIQLINSDIEKLSADALTEKGIPLQPVDLIIGGPPCQSYSLVGKRQYDQRAKMYNEYLRMLKLFKPKMFVFENVTGLLSMKNDTGLPVIEDIQRMFSHISDDLGYRLNISVLNAQDFGVPQSRARVFLVGTKKSLNLHWVFPEPNHGSNPKLKPLLTVADAISDLPPIGNGESASKYNTRAQTNYQLLMRGTEENIRDHKAGLYGKKILTIMGKVPEGEGRPYINRLVENGELDKEFYLTSGYHNTYGRLWWEKPSTTITNSLGTPSSLRCIHPRQDRALTTREGARLQSFPDWVQFFGSKSQKNAQVGNAVPPLLAIAIGKAVLKCLNSERQENDGV